jgi:hypothetical protein
MELAKLVVRYANGQIIKGFSQNFFPNKPAFHIHPVYPETSNETMEVSIKELKGLFFVRDFAGDPKYIEQKTFPDGLKILGRKVEVTFRDSEVLTGATFGYDSHRPGFFFFPCDPKSNNLKVFVVSQAVNKVRYI